jgi:hypothetical protein
MFKCAVCMCVCVVLCSAFIFCNFCVILFLVGYSSHGTSFEDDLSLGAEGEWLSCVMLGSVQRGSHGMM